MEGPLEGLIVAVALDAPARQREVALASRCSATPSPLVCSRASLTDWSRPRSRCSASRRIIAQRSSISSSPGRPSFAHSPSFGDALAVIARHLRDQRSLARVEAGQLGADDQVAGVLVMVVVGDRHADVVQHRRRPQQLAPRPAAARSVRPRRATRASAARAARRARCGGGRTRTGRARLRTAASRTSGNSGSSSPRIVRARKMPSRRPASVASMPGEAADLNDRLQRHRGRQDDVAAPRLDARHLAPLVDRQRRERRHKLVERAGADHEPLHADVDAAGRSELGALRGRGEVAYRAAGAHQAAAVARPASRPRDLPRDVVTQALQILAACRALGIAVGEERLGHAHGADRERSEVGLARGPRHGSAACCRRRCRARPLR